MFFDCEVLYGWGRWMKKIVFGCDYVGFILKYEIVVYLVECGVEVIDKGIWLLECIDYLYYVS